MNEKDLIPDRAEADDNAEKAQNKNDLQFVMTLVWLFLIFPAFAILRYVYSLLH
jgi:hypothetical protein